MMNNVIISAPVLDRAVTYWVVSYSKCIIFINWLNLLDAPSTVKVIFLPAIMIAKF